MLLPPTAKASSIKPPIIKASSRAIHKNCPTRRTRTRKNLSMARPPDGDLGDFQLSILGIRSPNFRPVLHRTSKVMTYGISPDASSDRKAIKDAATFLLRMPLLKKLRPLFILISLFSVFSDVASADAPTEKKPLTLLRVTPSGEDVPEGNQIVFTFNRAVVPLGKMTRGKDEVPISITPELNCGWIWISPSSLACNLNDTDKLKLATKYSIKIETGIVAEDGAELEPQQHTFSTQRPDVSSVRFSGWTTPGTPTLRVHFNQPVEQESARSSLVFKLASGEVVPANIASGEEPPSKEQYQRVWAATPERELPHGVGVSLNLLPGLKSSLGEERGRAERDLLAFDTFAEFKFLGVRCYSNDSKELFIFSGSTPMEKCNPQNSVALEFNTPLNFKRVSKQLVGNPPIVFSEGENADWESEGEVSPEQQGYIWELHSSMVHVADSRYRYYLPNNLKANTYYEVRSTPRDVGWFTWLVELIKSIFTTVPKTSIKDGFGRELAEPLFAEFVTDNRLPNYILPHNNIVLEQGVDSEAPMFVNNLDRYDVEYARVRTDDAETSLTLTKSLPSVRNVQYAVPFGVREMLDHRSGAIVGTITTNPFVNRGDEPGSFFAQITPFQVHVKLGHFDSLVWVTDLATGKGVPEAQVEIYSGSIAGLHSPSAPIATAVTDAEGVTKLPGTLQLDPELQLSFNYAYGAEAEGLIVRVKKSDTMALLPLSPDFGLDSWRVSGMSYASPRKQYGHLVSWGFTAQGIYRAGDTIQYKLYVRDNNGQRLIAPPARDYSLEVIDPMGKTVHEVAELALNEFGGFSGEVPLPQDSAVGFYEFKLRPKFVGRPKSSAAGEAEEEEGEEDAESSSRMTLYPLRVLVTEFTPAPFKVAIDLSKPKLFDGDTLEITSQALLHSGGAFTGANGRITVSLEGKAFTPNNPAAKEFTFTEPEVIYTRQALFEESGDVDEKGALRRSVMMKDAGVSYGTVWVESGVKDDRGKTVANLTHADYFGFDRYIGVKNTEWIYSVGKTGIFNFLVVDDSGAIIPGAKARLKFQRQTRLVARIKEAGNAYTTNSDVTWEDAGSCEAESKSEAASCEFSPKVAGYYRVIAETNDTKGRRSSSGNYFYVAGKDYVPWGEESDFGMQIVPEADTYSPGEKAKYLIKNPFPGALGLVTIERYGVLHSYVRKFEGSTEILEVPIEQEYFPGFYLSVTVFSPRVDKPITSDQIDLGKPTFRTGYATTYVRDAENEVKLKVSSDQDTYKPGGKVRVNIAKDSVPTAAAAESLEYAVAVLDEAVFDLNAKGKDYYDVFKGLNKLDPIDLRNYSLLVNLIGRQKFEKKGANPGGDGGSDLATRTNFKFLAYWNPSLKAAPNGEASFEFTLPDNLTGWRVLVVAVDREVKSGLGETSFKVNKPTEIRPVLPNQITENDKFTASFSVMNRTEKERTVTTKIAVEGDLAAASPKMAEKKLVLKPNERQIVDVAVITKALPMSADVREGAVTFVVSAKDELDGDAVRLSVPVRKSVSLLAAASYGSTTDNRVEESILVPNESRSDVGGVEVKLSSTVISGLEGAFKYMRDYPYSCWEQRLTKGLMAASFLGLKPYLEGGLKWEDAKQVAEKTLAIAASFQAPNGGMTYYVPNDQYVDPYLSAYTALGFNWFKAGGYNIPTVVETKLHDYLRKYLKQNLGGDFYNQSMTASVRAVAAAALAANGKLDLKELRALNGSRDVMSLFGRSFLLQAASKVKGGDAIAKDTAALIASSGNETAGKFVLNQLWDDSYERILASPLRDNCAGLSGLLTATSIDGLGELPFKLVRSITQSRAARTHFSNTQENLFCVNAVLEYARKFEAEKPNFSVQATFDEKPMGSAKFAELTAKPAILTVPMSPSLLGVNKKMTLAKDGPGRMYYTTVLRYSPTAAAESAINSGIEVRREYSVERNGKFELIRSPYSLKKGELVRVELFVNVPAARNFVVINDPVPGGLEPLNKDLRTTSTRDAEKGEFVRDGASYWFSMKDWHAFGENRWSFYHQEVRHDSVRFYSEYLPPGNYALSYTAQAIADGAFGVMPTKAEEMYDPDVYGRGVSEELRVGAE